MDCSVNPFSRPVNANGGGGTYVASCICIENVSIIHKKVGMGTAKELSVVQRKMILNDESYFSNRDTILAVYLIQGDHPFPD